MIPKPSRFFEHINLFRGSVYGFDSENIFWKNFYIKINLTILYRLCVTEKKTHSSFLNSFGVLLSIPNNILSLLTGFGREGYCRALSSTM